MVTLLDETYLYLPQFAAGLSSILGTLDTAGYLPSDVKELMILRVSAINGAALEWTEHWPVAKERGLTTEQLYLIRDTDFLPAINDSPSYLSPLQSAALSYAHHSTVSSTIPPEVTSALRLVLKVYNDALSANLRAPSIDALVVEASSVVSAYNMISRLTVSLDVANLANSPVPWPSDRTQHQLTLPDGHCANVVTYTTDPTAPWIVCCNTLLTNMGMWHWALAYLLSPRLGGHWLGRYQTYNVLLHDQRGHGPLPVTSSQACTIPLLATDITHILSALNIPTPVHSVVGVAQGGATALSFGASYPHLTKSIIASGMPPRSRDGNREAWGQRIELAAKGGVDEDGIGMNMRDLGERTLPRWFPTGSPCSNPREETEKFIPHQRSRASVVLEEMIMKTKLDGFKLAAPSLMDYNLIDGPHRLLQCTTPTLLLAGSLDRAGEVAQELSDLQRIWSEAGGKVELGVIEGAGHVPVVDGTEGWWDHVETFLAKI